MILYIRCSMLHYKKMIKAHKLSTKTKTFSDLVDFWGHNV